jgi:hypothetical protein
VRRRRDVSGHVDLLWIVHVPGCADLPWSVNLYRNVDLYRNEHLLRPHHLPGFDNVRRNADVHRRRHHVRQQRDVSGVSNVRGRLHLPRHGNLYRNVYMR